MIKAWKNFFLGKDRRARVVSFLDPGKEGRKQVGRRLLQGGYGAQGVSFLGAYIVLGAAKLVHLQMRDWRPREGPSLAEVTQPVTRK